MIEWRYYCYSMFFPSFVLGFKWEGRINENTEECEANLQRITIWSCMKVIFKFPQSLTDSIWLIRSASQSMNCNLFHHHFVMAGRRTMQDIGLENDKTGWNKKDWLFNLNHLDLATHKFCGMRSAWLNWCMPYQWLKYQIRASFWKKRKMDMTAPGKLLAISSPAGRPTLLRCLTLYYRVVFCSTQ